MKKIFTILVYLIFANIILADPNGPGGELLIKFLPNTPIGTFSVSVFSTDYSWHWENNTVVPDNDLFFHAVSGKTVYTFGSPKTDIGHGDYRISWGLFTFTITTNTGLSRTFQLDLRDENWAELYFPSHDTYILINDDSDQFYISKSSGGGGTQISNGAFIELWEFWDLLPLQTNFKIPVTLKNRIEGGPSTDFGSLWANNHTVSSGSSEGFKFNAGKNVQHYTIETDYNNERKYSFKWIPTQVQLTNNYSSSTNFTILITSSPKNITRNFRTVWPLTIKNFLPEISGTESFGNIYFKDPTTDNQFHSYPAAGNGFVKNEAFKELNENIPGYGFSKYSVKAVSPISHNGRNYYWYSGDFNPTTQTDLLITAPTIKTAGFKGTQLSNDSSAYAKNSQRKFVRTDDGWLHSVYSSLGRVFYEAKAPADNWQIMNGGQPLDNGEGKLPSIDYSSKSSGGFTIYQTVVVYQEKFGSGSKIKIKYFEKFDDISSINFISQKDIAVVAESYQTTNTTPVVGFSHGNTATIIWKNGSTGKLYGWYGTIGSAIYTLKEPNEISGTTVNSVNPTIYSKKSGTTLKYQLAWEEAGTGYVSSIKYAALIGYFTISGSIHTPSENNGYTRNYSPSIVSFGDDAALCWIAYRKYAVPDDPGGNPGQGNGPGDPQPLGETKVFFKSFTNGNWSQFYSYGNNINSVSINRNSNNTFAFAWSEGSNNVNKFVRSDNLAGVYTTNTTGRHIQVGNFSSLNTMRLNSFTTSTTPYSFSLSNPFTIDQHEVIVDREGVIVQDTTAFYFSVGEISVDGQTVDFVLVPDTLTIGDKETLNSYLISEPFNLTDNSSFVYSVKYGITDSLAASQVLNNGESVRFRVELIDAQTGDILGTFDDVTYNAENIIPYENIAYQVNTQGIGNRTCRLRLVTEDNLVFNYSLVNSYNNEGSLFKKGLVERTLEGKGIVKTYELSQNYPNPFNPTTTVKYQIPKSGIVMLKVYDILGSEIAKLVNEFQNEGKYEVNFEASSLASGIYIYRLNVNDPSTSSGQGYVSVKKMVLLK